MKKVHLVLALFFLPSFLALPLLANEPPCSEELISTTRPIFSVDVKLVDPGPEVISVDGKLFFNQAALLTLLSDQTQLGLKAGDKILVTFIKNRMNRPSLVGRDTINTYLGLKIRPLDTTQNIKQTDLSTTQVAPERVFELYGRLPMPEEYKELKKQNKAVLKKLRSIKTRQDYDALETKMKREVLVFPNHPRLKSQRDLPLGKFKGSNQKSFVRAMKEWFDANTDFELELGDRFATQGKPTYFFSLITTPSGEILGGTLRVRIKGVEFEDESKRTRLHFKTLKEAKKHGADEGEISWSANAIFNYDLSVLEHTPTFQWSGH